MALSAPGLAMQRITTAEPDEAICEVAIAAMNAALTGEVPVKEEPTSDETAQSEESGKEEAEPEQAEVTDDAE